MIKLETLAADNVHKSERVVDAYEKQFIIH